jgi:hypothetical protein
MMGFMQCMVGFYPGEEMAGALESLHRPNFAIQNQLL